MGRPKSGANWVERMDYAIAHPSEKLIDFAGKMVSYNEITGENRTALLHKLANYRAHYARNQKEEVKQAENIRRKEMRQRANRFKV